MKEEKTITITAPEGYEVDKERSSFEKIVFRALPEKGLPKTYGELGIVVGYKVCNDSTVEDASGKAVSHNKGIFPTPEEAEASIALAQLCQLRDRYNGGWKPEWTAYEDEKFCINVRSGSISRGQWHGLQHVLYFKTEELRDKFIENFSDLIEKAKPLLG